MSNDYFNKYILDDQGEPHPCSDRLAWEHWFESDRRIVAQTWTNNVFVSTIFLGLNHNYVGGPPILWETMAFYLRIRRGELLQWRYTSKRSALIGHNFCG